MKNLLLTTLLSMSFISAAATNENFQLSKAQTSNLIQSNDYDSCEDQCYQEFGDCLYSGEYDFICEIIYDECSDECYYEFRM